ncbi:Uncharacterised protein [Vibrio cholerae]|nr:Uncharacterised protein [Vibrio cholerae]
MGDLFHRGFGIFRAGLERCRDDHWYRRFYFNGSHWLAHWGIDGLCSGLNARWSWD